MSYPCLRTPVTDLSSLYTHRGESKRAVFCGQRDHGSKRPLSCAGKRGERGSADSDSRLFDRVEQTAIEEQRRVSFTQRRDNSRVA